MPLAIVIFVLAMPVSNIFKMLTFLLVMFLFLQPKGWKEYLVIIVSNIVFVVSDIGAINAGFFRFATPDFLGLPSWEFVAWGFWIFYAYRLLPKHFSTNLQLPALMGGIAFSLSFILIENREMLLVVSIGIIVLSLKFLKSINNYYYIGYFALIGLAVEITGLSFHLWTYPNSNLIIAAAQFLVMWAGIGLFFRNLIGPFLFVEKLSPCVIRTSFDTNPNIDPKGKKLSGDNGLFYTYDKYIEMSEQALYESNTRKAIECLREAVYSASNPTERARAHLLLSQSYRMIIQMKNASKEIELAFKELNLEIPRNFSLQTIKALFLFIKNASNFNDKKIKNIKTEELLRLQVALYVEVGLSGYYLKQDALMFQASLRGYYCAKRLGNSIEMINWYGGSYIICILKGQKKIAAQLKKSAEVMLAEMNNPKAQAKWNIWLAISLDYIGESKKSVDLFKYALEVEGEYLQIHDRRLGIFTMCCNLLLRGHFEQSSNAIEYLINTDKTPNCSYFSQTRRFIDWYKIGAHSFLSSSESVELKDNLKMSKAIFSQQDHEKWAITQYLGNLLFCLYNEGSEDSLLINDIEKRFLNLNLAPANTYIEAAFFWIALALVRLEEFAQNKIELKKIRSLIGKLKKLPNHPILNQHVKILEDRFLILISFEKNYKVDEDFVAQLKESENLLGLMELERNKVFFTLKNKDTMYIQVINNFKSELKKLNWHNYITMNTKWLAHQKLDF